MCVYVCFIVPRLNGFVSSLYYVKIKKGTYRNKKEDIYFLHRHYRCNDILLYVVNELIIIM